MVNCSAFTIKADKLINSLVNDVIILFNGKQTKVKALWDTGATRSCISMDVVKDLDLVLTGYSDVKTPSGQARRGTYLVNVALPNHVAVRDVKVFDSEIGKQGLGMLIGMDIILLGDFTVSSYGGKTTFTFRYPSQKCTDYVAQIQAQNTIGKKHGTGKRKHQ